MGIAFADTLSRTLKVRKAVLVGFLVGTYQKVSKLAAGSAGLCQQLRNRQLQQVFGKQEAGFQRHAGDR